MNDIASGAEALAGQAEVEAPAAAPEAGNAPWYGQVEQDLGGYIENKGWKSAKDMASGYQNLEKLFGADRAGNTVMVPKEDDAEAWGDLYGRLGRPGEASQYELQVPDDADENVINWFKEQAFQNGLNQRQAESLYNSWNELNAGALEEHTQQQEQQSAQEMDELKRQWGQAYDANIRAGRNAASRFGFSQDELSSMENALGTKNLLERMASIGKAFGEDRFEAGEGKDNGFGLTPAQAQSKIGDLKTSSDFKGAYLNPSHPGHKEAVEKMARLTKAAYPEG